MGLQGDRRTHPSQQSAACTAPSQICFAGVCGQRAVHVYTHEKGPRGFTAGVEVEFRPDVHRRSRGWHLIVIAQENHVVLPGFARLDRFERNQIAELKAEGFGVTAIACALGRDKSTISRKVRRDTHAGGYYRLVFAEGSYRIRRKPEAILGQDTSLCRFIIGCLSEVRLNADIGFCFNVPRPAEDMMRRVFLI